MTMLTTPNEYTLPNGGTVLCFSQTHLHTLEMGLYLKGGSLYETTENQGISHLVERLCLRSLMGLSHEALYARLDRIGATLTGHVYPETVLLRIRLLPRHFDEAMELLLRAFQPPEWTQDELRLEKQIVRRQIENTPPDFERDEWRAYWRPGDTPLAPDGTLESIEQISLADIHAFARKLFQPANACLCLSGNFSAGMETAAVSAMEQLEKREDKPPFSQQVPVDFCARTDLSDALLPSDWDKAQVRLSFDINDDLVFPLCADVLNHIAGQGESSLLGSTMRSQLALTNNVRSVIEEVGLFRRMIIAYTIDGRRLAESLKLVFATLARLCKHVSADQLLRCRPFFTDNLAIQLDRADEMNELLGWGFLSGDTARADLSARSMMYEDMTCPDLVDAAQAIFRPENMSCTIACGVGQLDQAALRQTLAECRRLIF